MLGGVDVLTTGNHVWRQKEVYSFLATDERIVRPANYPTGAPGRGVTVRPAADGGVTAAVLLRLRSRVVLTLQAGVLLVFLDRRVGSWRRRS